MKKQIASVIVVLYVVGLSMSPVRLSADPKSDLDIRWVDFSEFTVRLVLDWPGVRWFMINKADDDGPELPVMGFSSPFLSFGPAARTGVLRECRNPLGYSAGSDVFFERSGIVPSIACDVPSGSFVLIEPVPDRLSLYGTMKENSISTAGGVLVIEGYGKSFLEVFGSVSFPEADDAEDEWYAENAPFFGGDVVHCGVRGLLESGSFDGSLSAIASFNRFSQPGFLSHCTLHGVFDIVSIETLIGVCSEYYRKPDGDASRAFVQAEGELTMTPVKEFCFSLLGGIDVAHPASLRAVYVPHDEYASVNMRIEQPLDKHATASFEASGNYKAEYDEDGRWCAFYGGSVSADYDNGFIDASGVCSVRLDETGDLWADTAVSLGFSFFGHSVSLAARSSLGPDIDVSGSFAYEFESDGHELTVRVSMKKPYSLDPDSVGAFADDPFSHLSLSIGYGVVKKPAE